MTSKGGLVRWLATCWRGVAIVLLSTGLLAFAAGRSVEAAAGINKQISFQGKVVNSNGTNVADNTYTFVFSIYSVSSGGSAIWTETKSIAVDDGVFQTNLGSVTSLPGSIDFNSDSLYLGVNFNSDGEMTPRVQLTAVPYAFNSDMVGGLQATDFLRSTASDTYEGINSRTLTIQSDLTSGNRTANLLSITQSNDTSYNMSSGSLLGITNSDTGSAANLLSLSNSGSGAALLFAEGTSVANGIQWGTDTNLYRAAANLLRTDDSLVVYGGPAVLGNTDTDTNTLATSYTTSVIVSNTSTALSGKTAVLIGRTSGNGTGLFGTAGNIVMQPRDGLSTVFLEGGGTEILRLTDAGQLQIYNSGSTAGLSFGDGAGGYDTNLYRSGSDALRTDDNFTGLRISSEQTSTSSQSFTAYLTGDTYARYLVTAAGVINWGDGTNARDTNLYRSAANILKTDDSFVVGGSSLDLLAQADLRYYDSDSSNYVAFQSPATVASNVTWTLPSSDTLGCLASDGSGNLSWGSCGGSGGAPTDAQYVTLALNSSLSAERVLTGTANQVILTDGGANGNITLSLPQDIHTAANPRFASLGLGVAANSTITAYAFNNSFNTSSYVYGFAADTGNVGTGWVYGVQGVARATAAGTGDLIGVYGAAVKNSSVASTLSNMVGVRAGVTIGTTGSVTTVKSLDVMNPAYSAAGLSTDVYGVYVADITTTGATNKYGLAIAGADTQALWVGSGADNTTAADGIAFGSSRDTVLYRTAANMLATDDNIYISDADKGIAIGGTPQGRFGYYNAGTKTDTATAIYGFNSGLTVQGANTLAASFWSNNTTSATGTVGAVYGLYDLPVVPSGGTVTNRFGTYIQNPTVSGTLSYNYGLFVNDQTSGTEDYGLVIAGADTQALWIGSGADNTTAADGIAFGLSRDTTLYRSAADLLKTDDTFQSRALIPSGTAVSLHNAAWSSNIYSIPNGSLIDWASDGSWYRAFGATSSKFTWQNANDVPTVTELMALVTTGTNVGQLQVPVTGANAGLLLGGDALLYRSAADTLRTDDLMYHGAVNGAAASANAITLAGTLGIMNGSDAFKGIYIAYTNATHTGSSNIFYGIDIANITANSTTTERAINIGTGWDNGIVSASPVSTTYINAASGSGNGISLSGTLGIFNGSDTFNGINIGYTNSNHTGTSNAFNAINVANITGDAEAVESGLKVGTGWDYGVQLALGGTAAIYLSDTTGVAASGILMGTDTTLYRGAANELRTDDLITFSSSKATTDIDFKTYKASGSYAYIFDTSASYSSGTLLSVRNYTSAKMSLDYLGNMIISGTLTQSGTPADLSENIQVSDDTIGAGEIVTADSGAASTARRATNQDRRIMGVISTEPGILISGATNGKPLALSGRVPVKVKSDADIHIGDSVIVSDEAGIGTKGIDTVAPMVGVALSDQDGEDTVVVQLQFGLYLPMFGSSLANSALSPQYQSVLNSFTILDNNLLHISDLSVDRLRVATLTVDGQIVADSLALSDQSAGRGVIAAGQTQVFVTSNLVESTDQILITPVEPETSDPQSVNLYRGQVVPQQGFWVKLVPSQTLSYDQPFDWLVIK